MHTLHGPSKKASINSLLNPEDSSIPTNATSAGVNASQSHSHVCRDAPQYPQPHPASDGAYSLRTATWDIDGRSSHGRFGNYDCNDEQPRVATPQCSASIFDHHYHTPRLSSRQDSYSANDHWLSEQSSSYDPPFSEERNAQFDNFYHHQSAHSSNYRSYSELPPGPQRWQISEPASVRLAARGTPPVQMPDLYTPSPLHPVHQEPDLPSISTTSHMNQRSASVSVPPPPESGDVPATTSKRPFADSEEFPARKTKRVKGKGKATTARFQEASTSTTSSRRGYNAKKRKEAAIIAAQNANAYSNVQGPGDDAASMCTTADGEKLFRELQFARCMSNRYRSYNATRCVSCTRRWAGDTCRFQGIRYFLRNEHSEVVAMTFNEENKRSNEIFTMDFPRQWNRKLEREHTRRSKLSIAKALLPTLQTEQIHIQVQEIVRRPRETDVRVTCDTCMTSLFSTSFMCRHCGREVCNECFQIVKELYHPQKQCTPEELPVLLKAREKHALMNPFFLSCLKRNDHEFIDFVPVTRFIKDELDKAIEEMQGILEREAAGMTMEGQTQNEPLTYTELVKDPNVPFPDPLITPVLDDFTPSNVRTHVTSIPTYQAQIIPASLYDPASPNSAPNSSSSFASLWEKGVPLLVKDVLPRFNMPWNPDFFMETYGDENCLIVECQTDENMRVSVREFFQWFGKYEGRTNCWKLKDWPPTAEFKTTFPKLFADFIRAVPVPDYVRRDGVYNIGSHFPVNALGPDLGPKMYNSLASSQEQGSKGSTRLHMDMADAFNVMVYATDCEDGTPGYAVWDLFRAEDSDKIRAFLRKRFTPGSVVNATVNGQTQSPTEKAAASQLQAIAVHDPIHSQHFYLDVELRKELWEQYSVKSYRIYQRPGEGVFIPAGCAHQVANMADCIKIAIDFVSPENIDRCEKLTKEFREQNQRKAWKEDVLQLRTMMWFAWQSCSQREAEIDDDDEALGGRLDESLSNDA